MTAARDCWATAHSNIALVKYWGKRDGDAPDLNLPAVGSLSMTLGDLRTVTRVGPAAADRFALDGADVTGKPAAKVFAHPPFKGSGMVKLYDTADVRSIVADHLRAQLRPR